MATLIGLMDYDVLRTRHYYAPNYDVGLTYAYLKNDTNLNVRLISSPFPTNLEQYSKIYVFKQSKQIPHPSGYIKDYYKLPIEEYGPGFKDKPLRPFFLETREMLPDCSCYNNMIMYSLSKPGSPIAWTIDQRAVEGKYKPIRLYEKLEGEELKKDYPTTKYNLLYDDPVDILNNNEKLNYYNELLRKKYKFKFAQTLDISRLKDTNTLEQVIRQSKYSAFRRRLVATEINGNLEWLVDKVLNKEIYKTGMISVKLPVEEGIEACFEILLLLIFYNHKTHFRIKLRPM